MRGGHRSGIIGETGESKGAREHTFTPFPSKLVCAVGHTQGSVPRQASAHKRGNAERGAAPAAHAPRSLTGPPSALPLTTPPRLRARSTHRGKKSHATRIFNLKRSAWVEGRSVRQTQALVQHGHGNQLEQQHGVLVGHSKCAWHAPMRTHTSASSPSTSSRMCWNSRITSLPDSENHCTRGTLPWDHRGSERTHCGVGN